MEKIKTVLFVGDSHTWGQGVGGDYRFQPGIVGADKRMMTFFCPNYVNLIRHAICEKSGSAFREYCAEDIISLCGNKSGDAGILSANRPVTVQNTFGLCRIFLIAGKEPVSVTVRIDGDIQWKQILQTDGKTTAETVFPLSLFAENGREHTLTICADGDGILLHRIELYSGEFAVVNCGIGSCPIQPYLDRFFTKYVTALDPYAIVFEGNTINDWLTNESPSEYAAAVERAIAMFRTQTPRIMAHTVFPIAGAQVWKESQYLYVDYINTMKAAVQKCAVPLADSYTDFCNALNSVPEDMRSRFLYHDNWHPNGTGHYIYAHSILPILKNLLELN